MKGNNGTVDVAGLFGSPDGSRAELDDVLTDFVEFDADPGFGGLATRADDSKVRVIAGKLGAGKTVYMRRLQDHQAHEESVYAHLPEYDPPTTEVVVTAGQFDILVELVCADRRQLLAMTNRIRALDGVVSTESFLYLELRKQLYDWGARVESVAKAEAH